MRLTLLRETAIPLRSKRHEADDKGADRICDAWSGYVCVQGHIGICSEYPSAWSVYDCVYDRIPEKSVVPDLHLCAVKWDVFWIFGMVGALFISVDGTLGLCDAASKKNAAPDPADCIYGGVRGARIFIRDAVCSGTGGFVRAEPGRYGCMDCGRAAVGFSAWSQ